MRAMSTTTRKIAWQALAEHHAALANTTLQAQFAADPQRFQRYSLQAANLLFDFSKQPVDQQTLPLLVALAESADLSSARERLFAGDCVNTTEQRPALHAAWRWPTHTPFPAAEYMSVVKQTSEQLSQASCAIRKGEWAGISGERFTDIIHIGIGGSSLGPQLLYDVVQLAESQQVRVHFVETADASQLHSILRQCQGATTAIIIASKSFTTDEPLTNATFALDWLQQQLPAYDKQALIQSHCFAITAHSERALALGVKPQHVFITPDWVGGRYSVWSATSFAIRVAVGNQLFDDFLAGAYAMDQHFLTTPLIKNIPVIYGLLRIWLRQFWQKPYYAILPYAYDLRKLPVYLQQLEMESNGKSIGHDGTAVTNPTTPLLWGGAQTQMQHSVHQWLHQGTDSCPVDFIACAHFGLNSYAQSTAETLFTHCLSQSAALMQGITQSDCEQRLITQGIDQTRAKQLSIHQALSGNRPSNTIVLTSLDASTLGALLALYEHATFVQAHIWQINPFDQWGIEEGKRIAKQLRPALTDTKTDDILDPSTAGLIAFYQQQQTNL